MNVSQFLRRTEKMRVNVQIMKAQDANTVQVAKEAQNKIDEFVKIMMT